MTSNPQQTHTCLQRMYTLLICWLWKNFLSLIHWFSLLTECPSYKTDVSPDTTPSARSPCKKDLASFLYILEVLEDTKILDPIWKRKHRWLGHVLWPIILCECSSLCLPNASIDVWQTFRRGWLKTAEWADHWKKTHYTTYTRAVRGKTFHSAINFS